MRNRYFVVLGIVVLVAILAFVQFWTRSDAPVSRERCERINVGMSLAEVEDVLGGSPGDYRTGDVKLDGSELYLVAKGKIAVRLEWWHGDEGSILVAFDPQGVMTARLITPGRRVSYLDKLQARLGY